MAEWLYERGIGENRAALVADGAIIEAAIELPGRISAGSRAAGRLVRILVPGRRGIAALDSGGEALVEPLPPGVTEGAALRVEIVREAGLESGRTKLPKARATAEPEREGAGLRERIAASGHRILDHRPPSPDRLEEAGWSELIEQAMGGDIPFPGGALRMSVTPAMTLFDVDGTLPPAELALAGARAAAAAIRRFGIGGSIGVDLPTLPARADRQAAAAAIDEFLPQPFERTAVNGFGFLQIVRRRERASIPELLLSDPVGAAARALLRRAERSGGGGARTIHAAPPVVARLEESPHWLEALRRRLGVPVGLQAEAGLAISAGHVHSHFA